VQPVSRTARILRAIDSVAKALEPGVRSRFKLLAMRYHVIALAFAMSVVGCDSKSPASPEQRPTAPLVDVTPQSTLAPVRAAFNAHRGEARFLTLLSPT
jgi:hypothetical protein